MIVPITMVKASSFGPNGMTQRWFKDEASAKTALKQEEKGKGQFQHVLDEIMLTYGENGEIIPITTRVSVQL